MASFTLIVQKEENSDELFLEFPEELMRELDWRKGDTLQWSVSPEKASTSFALVNVSLEKRKAAAAQELKLYEVQVLVSHRVRYAVKATSAEEAAEIVMNEENNAAEFDQNCLGTQLFCSKEIGMDQYLNDPGHVGPSEFRLGLITDTIKQSN